MAERFQIFFAWQSDLADETNRNAIYASLLRATGKAQHDFPALEIKVEQSTSNFPGSPQIPSKILEQIKASEIFVCDISTVNRGESARCMPNPNVVFELGYAVSVLGWERILLVFNTKFGAFPDDVPFDFDRNRIIRYALEKKDPNAKGALGSLDKLLYDDIKLIVEKNPEKASEINLNPADIRRTRDLRMIRRGMSSIHFPGLYGMYHSLPSNYTERHFKLFIEFGGVFENPEFRINADPEVHQLFTDIYTQWKLCLSFDHMYVDGTDGSLMTFYNPMDMPFKPEQDEAWNTIERARHLLFQAAQRLLGVVNDRYIEIDDVETNRIALAKVTRPPPED